MIHMKSSSIITWICGAGAVILAGSVLLNLLTKTETLEICVGTYGDNLYIYGFDTKTLEFSKTGSAEAVNPSYALSENGCIYAVSETGDRSGIYSFDLVDSGIVKTAELMQTGADPCFIMTYGGYAMTADYSGGSVSVFPISDGKVQDCSQTLTFEGSGPVAGRQDSSHIHQLRSIPGREGWILASDLGADCIRLLNTSEEGLVHVCDIPCPAGSGPRHMEFSKDGNTLYCIAELSGNILTYSIEESEGKPTFNLIQDVQADEVNAGGSADIHLHPSGKYLYASHRLDNDGISIFKTNEDGTIEKIGYSRTARHPRNFMITEDGKFLLAACRDDQAIQVFSISEDGLLTLTPSVLRFESDRPSSVTQIR